MLEAEVLHLTQLFKDPRVQIATWKRQTGKIKRQIDDILAPQGVGKGAIETSSLRFKKLDTPNHYSIKKYEKNLNLV